MSEEFGKRLKELRKAAGIAPNTMTRLNRDEAVSLAVLEKICAVTRADFGDIVEYIAEDDR